MTSTRFPDVGPCDARGCPNDADWAYIGEGGDLFLCSVHGGSGHVEGWVWLREHDPFAAAALLVMACPWIALPTLPAESE